MRAGHLESLILYVSDLAEARAFYIGAPRVSAYQVDVTGTVEFDQDLCEWHL